MIRQIVSFFLVFQVNLLFSQHKEVSSVEWSEKIESVLKQTPKNRYELEKVLWYYFNLGDSLKYRAACFLLENMDIHYSVDYYWADIQGRRVQFNELYYKDFEASLNAFEEIKSITPGIHPVQIKYRDIDTITADYLIDNIEGAFETRLKPWAKDIPFDLFCEYVLPYRISVEPLQSWRKIYKTKFEWINDSVNSKREPVYDIIKSDIRKWFINTYKLEIRKEPLPRLGPLQLLKRKKGPCEDVAGLAVYMLRSQGYPTTENISVYWATSSGSHFWDETFENTTSIPFSIETQDNGKYTISREPSKIIRLTYSKQPETLASFVSNEFIPDGFLNIKNYIDVTENFWQVYDLECQLSKSIFSSGIIYAGVFNYFDWRPCWWGKVYQNKVIFNKMAAGVVYLPLEYSNHELIPAGYPEILYKSGYKMTLKPKVNVLQNIIINEQANYLIFRQNSEYKLYYWDNGWKFLETKKVGSEKQLIFKNVPKGALYILVPDYSQKKERPFSFNENGDREWW